MKYLLILTIVWAPIALSKTVDDICNSAIYCKGQVLDTIQRARIFRDSKTFVDMKMKTNEKQILDNFKVFMETTNGKPTKEQIRCFVDDNFEKANELDAWIPPDYNPQPKFLDKIQYPTVKNFAKNIVGLWPELGRKIKPEVLQNIHQYSLIPVPNGFIVAGGRFSEYYYWDTYWIVKGLLVCEMTETVRGLLDNFVDLVNRFGFIPNGGRLYYLNRSQPPLLSPMVSSYIETTKNLTWLKKNVESLEGELQYWLKNQVVSFEKDGSTYAMAHYDIESKTPRPESYAEDIETAAYYPQQTQKEDTYKELKSGAESGWDFSSRWIFDDKGGNAANLSHIATRRVIPVDLNAFLCKSFEDLSHFYHLLDNIPKSIEWGEKAREWKKNIKEVLWNEKDGIWYDFDLLLKKPRAYFYPSNVAPLWTKSYNTGEGPEYGRRVLQYLNERGIFKYQGGTPTSLLQTGEQWDFPNAWPPLQAIVVQGLDNSGDKNAQEVAKKLANTWVKANMIGYNRTKEMFEKYDAVNPGDYGGGGEYPVQTGFGWTNGVALEFISKYFTAEGDQDERYYDEDEENLRDGDGDDEDEENVEDYDDGDDEDEEVLEATF